MNFKQFSTSDNQWHDVPYYQHKTATDTLTLPAVIYPNDTSVTVGIKGNTTQSGTPSPQNPVDVVGTGERTGNFFDKTTAVVGERVYVNRVEAEAGWAHSDFIDISGADFITVRQRAAITTFYFYADKSNQSISYYQGDTAEVPNNAKYVRINMSVNDVNSNMLVIGSTAPTSYIPHGYKIPISSAGQTTPVYLGEVETTRQVKKLVLTGEEDWIYRSGEPQNVYFIEFAGLVIVSNSGLCTHYPNQDSGSFSTFENKHVLCRLESDNTKSYIAIRDSDFSTLSGFKAYLAQQYANGTPVTVWYVLATPQTGITNEPLMKIGDYADSLTTSIPCTAGSNTLDVQTTVAPSEVTATFEGWHPVSAVHERENGQWD